MTRAWDPVAGGVLADSATSRGGLGWLALTVVVSAGVAGLVNLLFGRLNVGFVKKKELEASVSSAISQERSRREMDRAEQIRGQVVALAGPIQQAAEDLIYRLDNIIDDDGDAPLDPTWGEGHVQTWSMSHEYALNSTEYLFARVFSYSEILRESLGSDLLWGQADQLLERMAHVGNALSQRPLSDGGCEGPDAQIFFWQQRALGSLLRSKSDVSQVIDYAEFLDRVPSIQKHLQPLAAMLTALPTMSRSGCYWARMILARTALREVVHSCKRLLAKPSPAV